VLGVGVPLAIALFFFVLGLVLMVAWRLTRGREFFSRKAFERVPPEIAAGGGHVESVGASEEEVPG
jgi:hypothetical protein